MECGEKSPGTKILDRFGGVIPRPWEAISLLPRPQEFSEPYNFEPKIATTLIEGGSRDWKTDNEVITLRIQPAQWNLGLRSQ